MISFENKPVLVLDSEDWKCCENCKTYSECKERSVFHKDWICGLYSEDVIDLTSYFGRY